MKKLKKSILTFLTALTLMLSGTAIMQMQDPVESHAWDENDIDVGSDGTVTINGVQEDSGDAFNVILKKYRSVITLASGLATITLIAVFIFLITKLGTTGDNPSARSKVIVGLITSGVAIALLGSVTLIVGVFYGFLQGDVT